MTPERLTELRSKVEHGYNLLAAEACEVFAHYGEPIEERRKRCLTCGGNGDYTLHNQSNRTTYTCFNCNGTGYEVAK